MRLTVAIPTYNRNETLRQSLLHLLPQLTTDCMLLILDDHSDVPVEDSCRDILADYPNVSFRIVRNKYNVGLGANILRCFELCETPWMWLLGDDDHPAHDAIDSILQHLEEYPDFCFLNFVNPSFCRTKTETTIGREEFIQKMDSWRNMLFMSVGIYHCPKVTPHLRFGYQYMYSYAPHMALLLASLGDNERCALLSKRLIQYQSPAGWAPVVTLIGKMALLDLPMSDEGRSMLARKLSMKPSLEATVTMLLHSTRKSGKLREALYQYDQICSRCYAYNRSWLLKARIIAYRLLLRFHGVGYHCLEHVYPALSKLAGYGHVKLGDTCPPDTFKRL